MSVTHPPQTQSSETTCTDYNDLRSIRQIVTDCVGQRAADARVLDALRQLNGFTPTETELWDYKRDVPTAALEVAKVVRLIVSLHNTFGGYAIFGVGETVRDGVREPVGIPKQRLNIRSLRDSIKAYTGEYVDVSYAHSTHRDQLVRGIVITASTSS